MIPDGAQKRLFRGNSRSFSIGVGMVWGGNGGDLAGSDNFGFAHFLFSPVFGMFDKMS